MNWFWSVSNNVAAVKRILSLRNQGKYSSFILENKQILDTPIVLKSLSLRCSGQNTYLNFPVCLKSFVSILPYLELHGCLLRRKYFSHALSSFTTDCNLFCFSWSEAEVMSIRRVVTQPRPFVATSTSNKWSSGICDCFHDLPQCKCIYLNVSSLTRLTYFTVRYTERQKSSSSLSRTCSWKCAD